MARRSDRERRRALSAAERVTLAQALVALPLVSASLRLAGFRRTERLLARLGGNGRRGAARRAAEQRSAVQEAEMLAGLVETAGAYSPLPAACLPRALTLRWLLRRQGIDGTLVFGVQPAGDLLHAHAWVEVEGVALGESDVAARFAPLLSHETVLIADAEQGQPS